MEQMEHRFYLSSHVGHVAYITLAFIIGGLMGYYAGNAYTEEFRAESDAGRVARLPLPKQTSKTTSNQSVSADEITPIATQFKAPEGWKQYQSAILKLDFWYPASLEVSSEPENAESSVVLSMTDVAAEAAHVTATNERILEVSREESELVTATEQIAVIKESATDQDAVSGEVAQKELTVSGQKGYQLTYSTVGGDTIVDSYWPISDTTYIRVVNTDGSDDLDSLLSSFSWK